MGREVSFGRLLREKKTPIVRESIVEDIDKACSNGILFNGVFSPRKVSSYLRKMIEGLGEFDRDKFFGDFFDLYSLVMAPDGRAQGVFHPSQLLDACQRQMYFELTGEEPTDSVCDTISGSLRRTFDVGTWYHLYMQNVLFKLGMLEGAEVPVVNKEKYLNGKADGVFKKEVFGERVVLEIKTMNSFNFGKAVFKPFKKHEFQASLYARELGIKKVLYLYINKDTSEIRDFLMPINEEQLKLADAKMNNIIASIKSGTLPKKSCKDKYSDCAIRCPFVSKCFID